VSLRKFCLLQVSFRVRRSLLLISFRVCVLFNRIFFVYQGVPTSNKVCVFSFIGLFSCVSVSFVRLFSFVHSFL